ncbi:MAG: tRNA dimethylallyltransferase [Lentisphaeria bacterium]|nr:tRNA dimethylallyltransferase [Lentisphaeria bacterium]
MDEKVKIIALTGPTATGKTALAVHLARQFNAEIISVDSRQVYRGMDLGTGKDLAEYEEIPYHLIDIADPAADEYNLSCFCKDAFQAIADISARGKLPLLCGGTPLYLTAILQAYRLPGGALPHHNSGLPRERQNPEAEYSFLPPFEIDPLVLGIYFPRKTVHERIEKRLDARLAAGMCDEVQKLHDLQKVSWEKMEFFGLEYREIGRYLQGKTSFEEMRYTLLCRIRQFAKRQDIFFRKMEREGIPIRWLKEGCAPEAEELIKRFLNNSKLPEITFRMSETFYGKR